MTEHRSAQPEVPDARQPAHVSARRTARRAHLAQVFAAWVGGCIGIGLLAAMVQYFHDLQLLVIGSFGASAVLLYAAPGAPMAQPRNLLGGHVVSALVGVACFKYLPDIPVLQQAVAVATAIALMQLSHTLHPPGGATALIAVIGSSPVYDMGWGYLFPVLMGATVLLLVALVINNLHKPGSYPVRWD